MSLLVYWMPDCVTCPLKKLLFQFYFGQSTMKTALLVMVKVQQPSIGGWGHVAIFWLFTTARDRIVLYCIVLQRIAVLQSGPPLTKLYTTLLSIL